MVRNMLYTILHCMLHHTSIASSTLSPGTSTALGIGRLLIIAAIESASRPGNASKRPARGLLCAGGT